MKQVQRQQRQKPNAVAVNPLTLPPAPTISAAVVPPVPLTTDPVGEVEKPKKPVPYVRVVDYEEMKRGAGLL